MHNLQGNCIATVMYMNWNGFENAKWVAFSTLSYFQWKVKLATMKRLIIYNWELGYLNSVQHMNFGLNKYTAKG